MPYQPTNRPRPILKHFGTSSSSSDSDASYAISLVTRFSPSNPKGVHFPGPEQLERMHIAHSPDAYDRSPIAVRRNECELPERGCPGRTYEDVMDVDTEEDTCYESTPGRMWKSLQHGDRSHPRARIVGFDTRSGGRPSLIPDLSDTSEDSDSSAHLSPFPDQRRQSSVSSAQAQSHAQVSPRLSPKSDPAQLAFLPHPHPHSSSSSPSYFNPSVASSHARDARSQHRALSSPTNQRTRSRSRVRGSPVRERRTSTAEGITKRGRERESGDEGCLGGF